MLYWLHADLPAAQIIVTRVLGLAILLTALSLFLRKPLAKLCAKRVGEFGPGRVHRVTILSGAILGVMVSISSVGAGAIGVTVLLLLYPKLPMSRVVGSDIAHAVPLTLLAGLGHLAMGSIDVTLLVTLLVGSLPGVVAGSHLSARLPDRVVRYTLAAVLFAMCGKMFVY